MLHAEGRLSLDNKHRAAFDSMRGTLRAVMSESTSTSCHQHGVVRAEEIPPVVAVDPLTAVALPSHSQRHPVGKLGRAAVHPVRVPVVIGKRTVVVASRRTRPVDGQARRALSGAVDRVAVAGMEGGARLLVHHDGDPLVDGAAIEAVLSGPTLAVVMASSSARSCSELVIRTADHLSPIRSIDPPAVVVVDG